MIIYFITFIISFIFAKIAEKNHKKNKIMFLIFSILAIVIPSLIAGIRASGVGTDTGIYIDWVFRANVHSNNIADALSFVEFSNIEILYCLINYFVSIFSNDLSFLYFVLEFIFLGVSYCACVRISKKINISFSYAYLVLLLLFFNKSLNLCRQSLAMAFCLYSVIYIFSRDLKKFFSIILIAIGFHNSAVLFIPLYFIYNIVNTNNKINVLIKLFIICLLSFSVIFFKPIVICLANLGIISEKFLYYVYSYGNQNNITLLEICSQFIILILTLLVSRKLKLRCEYNSFLVYVVVLSFVTFLFGYNASYSQRISYYFSFCLVLVIPQFIELLKNKKNRIYLSIIIILILCCYYSLYYGKYQFDQTIPYQIDVSSNKIIK